ncbi:hypothetical protein GMORB2_5918 [Geosmithia morbida]|uniref:AMP-activated protein kinase glycogen-binding domain-containing protein n=1 Tax=Geosmithia morbida TaxID=1094350 RepID=A0A9P5D2T1_9HYPO|nr:uncharacterized protein GMORB2_5918 [Geosmithia morbida]KAF4124202.1 hypothetical protein GMORB2_5918 [Geosmithia morbida]
MSAQLGTTTTVTFHKPGTTPPVFLAGSFVSPSWKQPQEMSYVHERDSDGENVYIFSSTVHVAHGHDYQYKFRIGQGPWVLDETNHVATATH